MSSTLTIRKRGRPVTLKEAEDAIVRLIRGFWGEKNCVRYNVPTHVNDDDIVARDFLAQLAMTSRDKVKALHPSADIVGGRNGKVWVADDQGVMLSDVCYFGTMYDRRDDAWDSAAQRLGF